MYVTKQLADVANRAGLTPAGGGRTIGSCGSHLGNTPGGGWGPGDLFTDSRGSLVEGDPGVGGGLRSLSHLQTKPVLKAREGSQEGFWLLQS